MHDAPVLLVAAHGTTSVAGHATTLSLRDEIAAACPGVDVRLCFVDVRTPTLAEALDSLADRAVVVVPLLLSAGFHVLVDIPAVVAGRASVRVARHLGPDPLVVDALAERLIEAGATQAACVALVGVASAHPAARADLEAAAALLGQRSGRPVTALTTADDLPARLGELPATAAVSAYVLAEGEFVSRVRAAARGLLPVADPIGVHPSLVALVLARYEAAR